MVQVTIIVDPIESGIRGGKKLFYQILIRSPVVCLTQKNQEQRCGVERTIIGAEWQFATSRHFALAKFMQDFARFFIQPVVELFALIMRQHMQSIDGQLRVQGQRLVGGDDGVATEERCKPGNSCAYDTSPILRDLQRMEICDCSIHRRVEDAVIAAESGRRSLPFGKATTTFMQTRSKVEGSRFA